MLAGHQDPDFLPALAGLRFGQSVRWYARVGSTNDEAKRLAEAGAPEGLLVMAEEQTAGRGRAGRTWHTPPGSGLAVSLVLRPKLPPDLAPRLSMLAGVSTCEGIELASGLQPQLKWPNDVLVNGRKAGGILVESAMAGERLDFAVLGIGLNVSEAPTAQAVDFQAISLNEAAGSAVNPLQVLRSILERMEVRYDQLAPAENPALYEAWSQRVVWLGERVAALTAQGEVSGVAEQVAEDGALLVRVNTGALVRVLAGDVRLRPAEPGAGAARSL
jgi:BirA family transcriptional regulator, biotin operon repressor / biotin---[acetyl-CoA-carboxylase] ligase